MAYYDPSLFEQQRRNLLNTYGQQQAMNTYQRYLAETQGQRPITELQDAAFGVAREVPRLTASYGKRGLQGKGVKSGVYQRALGDYASTRAKNLGYAQTDLANQLQGYDLAKTQGQENYDLGLKDIESDKARQIASDAQALLALR
jgi:hypothetical protein